MQQPLLSSNAEQNCYDARATCNAQCQAAQDLALFLCGLRAACMQGRGDCAPSAWPLVC